MAGGYEHSSEDASQLPLQWGLQRDRNIVPKVPERGLPDRDMLTFPSMFLLAWDMLVMAGAPVAAL